MKLRRQFWILTFILILILFSISVNRRLICKMNMSGQTDKLTTQGDLKGSIGIELSTGPHRLPNPLAICNSRSESFWLDGFEDVNNTAWPWNYSDTWNCPRYLYNQYPLFRRKVQLDCSTGSPHLVLTMTDSPSDIEMVEPDNDCLLSYVQNCCFDKGLLVPNVLHYVIFSKTKLGFYTFLSLISVIRFMKPCIIIFHSPYIPWGDYWNYFISVYPYVLLVNETLVTEVFGNKLKFKEHGSDVMRIKVLQKYGGLYLDWDSSLVKPVEPLRKYRFTMGLEDAGRFTNSFIMAEPNATFLTHYYNGYKSYRKTWTYNSLLYPFTLSKKYPKLIHVEAKSLVKPIQPKYGGPSFFSFNSDWSSNYALHVYLRAFKKRDKINPKTIRRENSTLGAMCRRILLGKKELCTT